MGLTLEKSGYASNYEYSLPVSKAAAWVKLPRTSSVDFKSWDIGTIGQTQSRRRSCEPVTWLKSKDNAKVIIDQRISRQVSRPQIVITKRDTSSKPDEQISNKSKKSASPEYSNHSKFNPVLRVNVSPRLNHERTRNLQNEMNKVLTDKPTIKRGFFNNCRPIKFKSSSQIVNKSTELSDPRIIQFELNNHRSDSRNTTTNNERSLKQAKSSYDPTKLLINKLNIKSHRSSRNSQAASSIIMASEIRHFQGGELDKSQRLSDTLNKGDISFDGFKNTELKDKCIDKHGSANIGHPISLSNRRVSVNRYKSHATSLKRPEIDEPENKSPEILSLSKTGEKSREWTKTSTMMNISESKVIESIAQQFRNTRRFIKKSSYQSRPSFVNIKTQTEVSQFKNPKTKRSLLWGAKAAAPKTIVKVSYEAVPYDSFAVATYSPKRCRNASATINKF